MKRIWQVMLGAGFVLSGVLASNAPAAPAGHAAHAGGLSGEFGRRGFGEHGQSFFGGGCGFGGGWGLLGCYDLNAGTIPFFALHPPVYYSYPVARTYGYSPFAYGPDVETPPVETGGSAELINPYVSPKPQSKATPAPTVKPSGERTADANEPQSLTITNPYVEQGLASADQPSDK